MAQESRIVVRSAERMCLHCLADFLFCTVRVDRKTEKMKDMEMRHAIADKHTYLRKSYVAEQ